MAAMNDTQKAINQALYDRWLDGQAGLEPPFGI